MAGLAGGRHLIYLVGLNLNMLTKSDFKIARKCPKALWMTIHMAGEKAPLSAANQARMKSGQRVGELARTRYPEGVLVQPWGLTTEESVNRTTQAIESGATHVFEATVSEGGCVARIDILICEGNGWHLQEVKASGRYKKEDHLDDVAFQVSVARRAGLNVQKASVLHLNREHVWNGEAFNAQSIFSETDVTDEVEAVLAQIESEANGFLELWDKSEYPTFSGTAPHIDPGIRPTCRDCEFKKHCFDRAPSDHIFFVGMHHSRVKKLKSDGITLVGEVPSDFVKDPKERLRFEALLTKETQISPNLAARLAEIQYPAYLIDFETLRPDLPLIAGTAPFELLPFQWSCHIVGEPPIGDGVVTDHREFLHQEPTDPRIDFCKSLLDLISNGGSVLIYSKYEITTLKDLAAKGVPYAQELLDHVPSRFIDLEDILKECYADHRFGGQTSIKAVLPVVSPDLSYKGLTIQNGDQAQIEYMETYSDQVSADRKAEIFAALKEYCMLDTLAMVMVLRALYSRA